MLEMVALCTDFVSSAIYFCVRQYRIKGQMHVAGLLGQRFLTKNRKSHSTDLSVSGDEGRSDPLRVAAEAGATLSTPTKAVISRERKVKTNPAEKKRNPIQM